MMPGLNPKKMQAVMRQMGISQTEIDADRVIIEKEGSRIIIDNPQITKIKMQGQESLQITGEMREESSEVEFNEEDIQTIIEKTGKTKEEAIQALEKTNDLAEAILELS